MYLILVFFSFSWLAAGFTHYKNDALPEVQIENLGHEIIQGNEIEKVEFINPVTRKVIELKTFTEVAPHKTIIFKFLESFEPMLTSEGVFKFNVAITLKGLREKLIAEVEEKDLKREKLKYFPTAHLLIKKEKDLKAPYSIKVIPDFHYGVSRRFK